MTAERIRVVLVDDDHTVLLLTRWLLEDDGRFDVVAEFAEPQEFITRCPAADLIVLDVSMRAIDGLTALDEIRHQGITTPAVIFSSYSQPYRSAVRWPCGSVGVTERVSDERGVA